MTTNHLKTGVESTPETSCTSNIPQTLDNVQHNVLIMNQPLTQTFTESLGYSFTRTEVFAYKIDHHRHIKSGFIAENPGPVVRGSFCKRLFFLSETVWVKGQDCRAELPQGLTPCHKSYLQPSMLFTARTLYYPISTHNIRMTQYKT
jgi:hypothetical protein